MKSNLLHAARSLWLAQTIDRNRALYGGLRMMADDPKEDPKGDPAGDPKEDPKADPKGDPKEDSKGDALGEGGKKALEAEREARKAAEKAATDLKSEFDGFKSALLEGLGIKQEGDDKGEGALRAVQEQLAAMQDKSSVLELANEHKITDKDDLELLAATKDADARKKLAERLAPSEEDPDAKSGRRPKADRTQGGGGDSERKGTAGGSVAQVIAERRAARAAATKS